MIFLRALLLDFDGLLVDTEPIHFAGFQEVAEGEASIELTEAVYFDRYVGYDDRDGFRAIWADHGLGTPNGTELGELVAKKAAVVEAAMEKHLDPRPGAVDFVRAASEIYRIGVCSGALRREVELGLTALGIREFIPHIVAADDVARSKPDPEGYRKLLGLLEADGIADGDPPLAANLAAVLEDTAPGLKSGRAAGCWTVGVLGTEPAAELGKHAHLVLDSLAEVNPSDLAELLADAVGENDPDPPAV